MANAGVHLATSSLAAALAASHDAQEDQKDGLTMPTILGGAFGGRLPDMLEPAVHPNHRGLLHSIAALGIAAWTVRELWLWQPTEPLQKTLRAVLIGIAVGYGTHLLVDSATPKSIPLI